MDNRLKGDDEVGFDTVAPWLRRLEKRFPEGNIDYHPPNGDTFISLPLADGGAFRAALTWQQARYLAYSDLTGDDVQQNRLPPDWPGAKAD